MTQLLAVFDWRSIAVLRRNALVYFRNWRTAFLPPAMEPVIFFLAFGLGLQGYVGAMDYEGTSIGYATYVAPGLVAYSAFGTAYYESLYSAYVRMFYQKTWDGILATQVELPHLVWGEILWSGARSLMNTAVVCFVLGVFTLLGLAELRLEWLLVLPLLAFGAGLCFAAFGLIFTAIVPAIDHMNYPVFLIGIPLSLISNTYFPVASEEPWLQALIELNPVYHLAETARGLLVRGDAGLHPLQLLLTCGIGLVVCALTAMRLTRRRVLS
ncbi:MAG: ABC transporter permease [Sandaracinaceae bacterium]